MAKNYVSSGETVEIPAPAGGVRAGKVYKIGDLTLIASTDGKEGDLVSFYTRGVFDFPKAASAIAAGAKIYWKGTSNNVDGSGAASDPLIGVALMEAAASSSTVKVLFRGF
jgi:predicted RecA/RadA family phage recombinase